MLPHEEMTAGGILLQTGHLRRLAGGWRRVVLFRGTLISKVLIKQVVWRGLGEENALKVCVSLCPESVLQNLG